MGRRIVLDMLRVDTLISCTLTGLLLLWGGWMVFIGFWFVRDMDGLAALSRASYFAWLLPPFTLLALLGGFLGFGNLYSSPIPRIYALTCFPMMALACWGIFAQKSGLPLILALLLVALVGNTIATGLTLMWAGVEMHRPHPLRS